MVKKIVNMTDVMSDKQKLDSAYSIATQLTSTTLKNIVTIFSVFDDFIEVVKTIPVEKHNQAEACFKQIFQNLAQIRDNSFTTGVKLRNLFGRDATEAMEITRKMLQEIEATPNKEHDMGKLYQKAKHEVESG